MPTIDQTDPLAPTRAVNELAQTLETIGCWGVAVAVIMWAYRMSRRQGTWLPLAVPLGAAVMSFNEPLFDDAYHLFWYEPGQWTLFSTFGIPQPVWVMGAYIIVYATPCLYIMQRLHEGASRQWFYKFYAVTALMVATWESLAIYAGTYTYFGEHPFRLGKYPAWLGIMEAGHIMVWGALVALLAPLLMRGWRPLLTIPLFGVSFCSVMFGAGLPGLAVINADPMPTAVMYLGAIGSMALASVLVWLVSLLMPSERPVTGAIPALLREWADSASRKAQRQPFDSHVGPQPVHEPAAGRN